MIYLWDSVTTIHFIKKNPDIKHKLDQVGDKNVYICHIVVGEIFYGIYNSGRVQENLRTFEAFLNEVNLLLMSDTVSKYYGQLKLHLKKKGRPIKENDLWIASYAKAYNAILVTEDKHFSYLDSLQIENWVKR